MSARETILLNYPETGDPGTKEHLLNLYRDEIVKELVAKQRAGSQRVYTAARAQGWDDLAEKVHIATEGIIDLIDPAVYGT